MQNVLNEMMLFFAEELTLSVANRSWGIFEVQAVSSQAFQENQTDGRYWV